MVNVDLTVSGEGYKGSMNMPVIAEQSERLREYVVVRLANCPKISTTMLKANDSRYVELVESNKNILG